MSATPHTLPPCPHWRKCGGCQLRNMDYERQLKFKQETVISLLGKYHRVSPILGMEHPYYYRNKVQAAFGLTRSGQVISGIYQSSSHHIVKVDSCQIEDQTADRIVVTIRKMLPSFRILPYNEDSRKGFLRHVLVRRGFHSGQIMVVLVGSNPIFPIKKKFVAELVRRHPEITTVVLNINSQHTSMLLGEREEVLFGPGYIEDDLCGCTFRLSPRSFYQINPSQTERLYRTALDMAHITEKDTVLDAYCGVGTIGIVAAKRAKEVVGVELNGDAVKDARINARRNNLSNISFVQGDAGEYMVELAESGEKVDVVLMDPPRAGSDKPFLESLLKLSPSRVVYISCNPETQARDLRTLVHGGYRVTGIQPVDMFPHTRHIECVVCLTKEKSSNARDKKQAFFENAHLLSEKFATTPLMYGSLGLEYLTGENLSAEDIDILIPEIFVTKRWSEFRKALEKKGYRLMDEREHTFEKDGLLYSYAPIEELESFCGIRLSDIGTRVQGKVVFKLLSLPQYLKVYTASSKDGYRASVRHKKDADKLKFIRAKLGE